MLIQRLHLIYIYDLKIGTIPVNMKVGVCFPKLILQTILFYNFHNNWFSERRTAVNGYSL